SPKPSRPTFVITAARRPSRAAATATFVGLPPRDFANVRTSASVTPICSGYRSTPTRPIVITSRLPMLPRVLDASCDPLGRARLRLAVEHHVVFEHVPTGIPRPAQVAEHILDAGYAFSKRTEEAGADRVVVGDRARAHARTERAVHV